VIFEENSLEKTKLFQFLKLFFFEIDVLRNKCLKVKYFRSELFNIIFIILFCTLLVHTELYHFTIIFY